MSSTSSGLFHSRVSPLLNLHRLTPRRLLDDVLATDLPLASQEGFVRQLLGWREFVHHVHERTDGLRCVPAEFGPNLLDARVSLPAAFWGQRSGLDCLDRVVADVWNEGWSHHITRLMVLSGLATLLDVDPRELCDWFWVAYVGAFDWVVEPSVLAMGTFSLGGLMTTKPYVSGAAYIDRMSDFCRGCRFDPRSTCPFTPLYWAFLARHGEPLARVARMDMPLRSLARREPELLQRDAAEFERVRGELAAGHELWPR